MIDSTNKLELYTWYKKSQAKKKKKVNTGLKLKLTAFGTSHELINF